MELIGKRKKNILLIFSFMGVYFYKFILIKQIKFNIFIKFNEELIKHKK